MTRLFAFPLLILAPALLLVGCDGGRDDGDTDTDTSAETDTETTDEDTDVVDTDGGDTDDTDGDDTDDTDTVPAPLAIAGAWIDDWGTDHDVADDLWTMGTSTFEITQYDNTAHFLVAQNGAGNELSAGLWSRFDWAWVDDDLRFCQTAYDAATEAAALAATPGDPTAADGCGGFFPWSTLRPPFAMIGTWDDNWGDQHTIDPYLWTTGGDEYAIGRIDVAGRWLVAQNGPDNTYNPDLWSRFEWTFDADGQLRFCQAAYDAASKAAAIAAPSADPNNLATGCGTFSWNVMREPLAIAGAWTDNWGDDHVIDAFTWSSGSSVYDITQADNDAGWLVAQNGSDNTYNPDLWSRFDWTWDNEGTLWFCQTAYAAETEAAALATPAADATTPSESGCGPFAWNSFAANVP